MTQSRQAPNPKSIFPLFWILGGEIFIDGKNISVQADLKMPIAQKPKHLSYTKKRLFKHWRKWVSAYDSDIFYWFLWESDKGNRGS